MRAQWHPRCTRFSFIPASLLIKALQISLSLCGHLGPHVGGGERQLSCRVTADGMALTLKHSGGLGLSSLELPASIRAMTARLTPDGGCFHVQSPPLWGACFHVSSTLPSRQFSWLNTKMLAVAVFGLRNPGLPFLFCIFEFSLFLFK